MISPRARNGAELLGAALLLPLLARLLPLAADDPFRATLLIIPLAVAALRAIERRDGALLPAGSRTGWLEAVLLIILVLLIIGRHGLGLAATDWFLAGGLLLLLGHRTRWVLVTLRPLLGQRLPSTPSWRFFALPFVVYLVLLPWSTSHRPPDGDEPYYLLLTHSLAYDLDADLTNNYAQEDWRHFMSRPIAPQPGDPVGPAGERRSRHTFLLPLLLAPAYRLVGPWGALATMAAMAAALAWMVLRLAHHYDPERPREALLAYALFAFTPPFLLYTYQVWSEVPAALLLCLALDRIEAPRPTGHWTLQRGLGYILLLGLMLFLKLRLGLIVVPLFLLGWWRARPRWRTALGLAASFTVLGAALLRYNQIHFENPLRLHHWDELLIFTYAPADIARGAFGMLYDAAFGLFACAPIWLLLWPALWYLARQRSRLLATLMAVALPYLVVLAPRIEWYGGWSPAFRYGLVFLPLLALALMPLLTLRHRAGMRWLISALGTVTLVLTVVWIVLPGWTYNLADGSTYLLDAASVRLGNDVTRFFPSMVRPRLATWLWPLASLLIVPLAFWRGSATARRSASHAALACVLLAAAALPALASRLPTRVAEVEDGAVAKLRGHLVPQPWTLERPRYRGGWMLHPRGELRVPVVPGGREVTLRLTVLLVRNNPRPFTLLVAAGDEVLGTWTAQDDGDWQQIVFGPVPWPAGASLVIRGPDIVAPTRGRNGVAIDKVELLWQ